MRLGKTWQNKHYGTEINPNSTLHVLGLKAHYENPKLHLQRRIKRMAEHFMCGNARKCIAVEGFPKDSFAHAC